MKAPVLKVSFIAFILIAITSCSYQQEHKYRIVFLQCCHDEWRDVMNSEMKRELAFHPDVKLETIESYSNTEKQIEQLKSLAKQKIDLLIITPNESKPLTAAIEEIYKAGIPIVFVDRKTESRNYTAFIGADNYEIGKTAGKFLASQFKDGGNIIEVQLEMTSSPATERNRGFKDAIADTPNLRIIESLETKNGIEDIKTNIPRILKEHPQTNIIFAHTDFLALTAYKAIEREGKSKNLFFVGIDAIPVTKGMQEVKNGTLNATLLYPTGGAEAIQTAIKILKKQPFKKENTLLTNVITSDNVDIMLSQIQKIKEQQVEIERETLKITELNKTYSTQRNRLYFISALLTIVVILGAILYFLLQEKQHSNRILEEQNLAILEQKNEIEKVSQLARKATEDKMRFYSYISHEFKTPLSLILTPTEDLLQRKNTDIKETRGTLQLIYKNANRLLRLVNQLLEMRKLDAGKMELELSQNDLVAFIKDIVGDFGVKAKQKHIDLQFISPFKELSFAFDAEKLDKVLFNIISNAFKYTPDWGLIHVSILKNTDKIEINIADNGIGMNAEEKAHAFDLFYRGNKNISLGTGLGLALSQEFVTLHGGEISINSEKDKGTTFKIILPIIETKHVLEEKSAMISSKIIREFEDNEANLIKNNAKHTFENTIILIEDNRDLNLFLNQKLEKQYNVVATENAEHGWQEILSYIPDVIICDVMLPGMDGFTLTQKVKSDFRTSHIPVILLTAKSQIESQIEGTKAGADDYILKPFNQQLLEEKLKGLVENRDRMRRRFSNEVINPNQLQKGERRFLLEFEALIDKNIKDSTLSVEKLSHEMGMSRVQLFRKISALTNKNVADYIAEYKLQKAKILLKEQEKNIAEIAYELGFSTPSYFTTFFKQKTNQTPTEWRNG
ncbi:substrate-binding domain-containing protein [Lacihabitans soyangensis]|uniref:histidine kinase n=1 Tax=Lacihabitans soyangensis TaxID=869394 RepID=A0AAE3KUL7_9BACT|nr:substrate-binding domain-containing protein [Lacihabitans soyangensis]MCP9765173.1 response regulator [Lacihabitans soyangensis]